MMKFYLYFILIVYINEIYSLNLNSIKHNCLITKFGIRQLKASILIPFLSVFISYESALSIPEQKSFPNQIQSREYVKVAVERLKKGEIAESVLDFDKAIELDGNLAPYLWQRGLALYFNEKYDQCSDQFKKDLLVNPKDTEETVWEYICRSENFPETNQKFMLKQINNDKRPIMRSVYMLFNNEITPEELDNFGSKGDPSSYFYSRLYLALYSHTTKNDTKALFYIRDANKSLYANKYKDLDLMVKVSNLFETKIKQILN